MPSASCRTNNALCVVLVNNGAGIKNYDYDYAKATTGAFQLRTNRQSSRVVGSGVDIPLPGASPQWPASQMFLAFG